MFQYSVSLEWSDQDEGYIARIPEFPNLTAFGESPEEALNEARIAAEMMLEVLEEDGEAPPEPRKLIQYSGQTRLRLSKSLHRDVAQEAEREGVSLNTLINNVLSEYMGRKKEKAETQKKVAFPVTLEAANICFTSTAEAYPTNWGAIIPFSPKRSWEAAYNWIPAANSAEDVYDTTPWPKKDERPDEQSA